MNLSYYFIFLPVKDKNCTFQLQEIRILFIYHWSIYYFGNLSFLSSGTELDSKMVEPDSGEEDNERKNHYSAVEEIINSTHKEVKTDSSTDCRQNTTESTNAVSKEFSYIYRQTL